MGMKKRIENGIPVTIWMDAQLVERIDRIAEKADLSRSKFMRNLLEVGIGEAEAMEAVGLLDFLRALEQMKSKIRERMRAGVVPETA